MRIHDETRSYVPKRTAEGFNHREVRRQVKLYLTRNPQNPDQGKRHRPPGLTDIEASLSDHRPLWLELTE
ncbi:hypothetical protein GCM10028784_25830 [Myceligenerans cantabricum]